MFVVNIDIKKMIEPYLVDRDSIRSIAEQVVIGVTYSVYEAIYGKAADNLRSTRKTYLRGLNQPIFGPLTGTIVLTGSLANMIEQGATAFDMKEGFLKSQKAKEGKKGGKYITIPFRWSAPGSLGESEAFSRAIPDEVHEMLKKLKTGTSQFGGGGRSGEGFNPKGTKFDTVLTRGAFQNLKSKKVFGSYKHKSPLTSGIQRKESLYENATQYQYMSFRRVSLASHKNSWIHPGMTARNFFELGLETLDIDMIAANIISEQLQLLGI